MKITSKERLRNLGLFLGEAKESLKQKANTCIDPQWKETYESLSKEAHDLQSKVTNEAWNLKLT